MRIHHLSTHILQFGLAFVFIYAAIQIFLNPEGFVHYTPEIIFKFMSLEVFMYTFATFEILLSLWIISGKKMIYSSLIAASIMALVIVFNLDLFIVLFRNVAIMCCALALAGISHDEAEADEKKIESPTLQTTQPIHTQAPVNNQPIVTPISHLPQQPVQNVNPVNSTISPSQ